MKVITLMAMSFFLIWSLRASSQNSSDTSFKRHRYKLYYLILRDTKSTIITRYAYIDILARENVKVLDKQHGAEIINLLGCDYIWVYNLNPEAQVFTLNDIFREYKISQKYRTLPIQIDEETVDAPETILISPNQIVKVEIVKSGGVHLSITLLGYAEIKKREAMPNTLYLSQ